MKLNPNFSGSRQRQREEREVWPRQRPQTTVQHIRERWEDEKNSSKTQIKEKKMLFVSQHESVDIWFWIDYAKLLFLDHDIEYRFCRMFAHRQIVINFYLTNFSVHSCIRDPDGKKVESRHMRLWMRDESRTESDWNTFKRSTPSSLYYDQYPNYFGTCQNQSSPFLS